MRLSIITINYNNKTGLQKTINSVISQTFKDFEWIIIDGGSTDGSKELIEKYNQYITYWVSEPDKGIYNAMNKGIHKASGDYLSFMNSGDTYYDNTTLNIVHKLTLDSNIDIYYGNSLYIYKESERVFYTPKELSLLDLYKGTILHQASFIKRELFKDQGYDERFKIVSDWKMWLLWFLQNKSFQYIDLIISRFDAYGISTTNDKTVQQEREVIIDDLLTAPIQNILKELDYYKSIDKSYPHLRIIYSYINKDKFYLSAINKVIHLFNIINYWRK